MAITTATTTIMREVLLQLLLLLLVATLLLLHPLPAQVLLFCTAGQLNMQKCTAACNVGVLSFKVGCWLTWLHVLQHQCSIHCCGDVLLLLVVYMQLNLISINAPY